MKKALLLTVVMLMSASLVFAQAGSIGLFADPGGLDCNVSDAAPALLPIFAVHVLSPCATAVQFAAPAPACMLGASFLSDTAVYPVTIGGSQTGVAIGYGSNVSMPANHVLTINFFGSGLTTACCLYTVVPDPLVPSGQIEVVDCTSNIVFATGGSAIVNSNPSCNCNVANEETTWGSVKALYE